MKINTISKLLHVLVILTFFLPFYYTGCGGLNKERDVQQALKDSLLKDSLMKDSIAKVDSIINKKGIKDSIAIIKSIDTSRNSSDTLKHSDSIASIKDTVNQEKDDKEKMLSDELVEKFPLLSIILMPSKETYSGLGAIINSAGFIIMFSLLISFILLIIGLTIKIIEPSSIKTIVLLDFLILIGMSISQTPSWNCDRLWGFWVCIILTSILLICDGFILIKNKR